MKKFIFLMSVATVFLGLGAHADAAQKKTSSAPETCHEKFYSNPGGILVNQPDMRCCTANVTPTKAKGEASWCTGKLVRSDSKSCSLIFSSLGKKSKAVAGYEWACVTDEITVNFKSCAKDADGIALNVTDSGIQDFMADLNTPSLDSLNAPLPSLSASGNASAAAATTSSDHDSDSDAQPVSTSNHLKDLAQADEYFGQEKLSPIGIQNVLDGWLGQGSQTYNKALDQRQNASSVMSSLKDVAGSVFEMIGKYPKDFSNPAHLNELIKIYDMGSKDTHPSDANAAAQCAAMRDKLAIFLAQKYPDSSQAQAYASAAPAGNSASQAASNPGQQSTSSTVAAAPAATNPGTAAPNSNTGNSNSGNSGSVGLTASVTTSQSSSGAAAPAVTGSTSAPSSSASSSQQSTSSTPAAASAPSAVTGSSVVGQQQNSSADSQPQSKSHPHFLPNIFPNFQLPKVDLSSVKLAKHHSANSASASKVSDLAPADEYFGPAKISVLGIQNALNGWQGHGDNQYFVKSADQRNSASFVANPANKLQDYYDATVAMMIKYPNDHANRSNLAQLIQIYDAGAKDSDSRDASAAAQCAATRDKLVSLLTTNYPNSDEAKAYLDAKSVSKN